jgi:hypothetical protein
MKKLKTLLADILSNLGFRFIDWAARLDNGEARYETKAYVVPPAPHSFTTFKEGMSSTDYCTRHDAASKLVGWYLYQNGHPLIEELVRAAEILLEDSLATSGDVSFLVGAWKDQASALSDTDREAAEQREHKIYEDLATKAANLIK